MNRMHASVSAFGALAIGLIAASAAQAELVTISISNPGNASFSLTPLWYGFHTGEFDLFNPGESASASLEALAEDGIVSGLQNDFLAMIPTGQQGVLAAPGGFPVAPVIEPGESTSLTFNRDLANRFFSFASMVIPSNDAFIGNPAAIELFNPDGSLLGGGNTTTINVFYEQIWDSGTEVNDTMGAAFSQIGGMSTDENGTVQLLGTGGLDNFLDTITAADTRITKLFTPGSTVATITITRVPEPASGGLALAALISVGAINRRQRRVDQSV